MQPVKLVGDTSHDRRKKVVSFWVVLNLLGDYRNKVVGMNMHASRSAPTGSKVIDYEYRPQRFWQMLPNSYVPAHRFVEKLYDVVCLLVWLWAHR
jgi:hypothetical protein